MKKLLALAGIALIAAACTNNDEPVQECGQINLTLENSTAPEIEVSTRTVTDLTETDAKDYNIQVLQNDNVKLESTNFLTFKNTTFIFPIGSGYTVTAESCTEEVGQSANDGVGQIRYFGTSAPFEVRTNEISNVKVTCTMANAKVSIAYDESLHKSSMVIPLRFLQRRNLHGSSPSTVTANATVYTMQRFLTSTVKILI